MTEYWVSQAKFFCKFCNIWIADNKPSRQHHDNGVKHKISIELYHRKKRDEKLYGARSERDLKQQLYNIEKAAIDAVFSDKADNNDIFHQNSELNATPAPPPPPPHSKLYSQANEAFQNYDSKFGLSKVEDSTGIYQVRGQTFLEGKKFEEKFKTGVKCEIFLEDEDEWVSCVIDRRKERPVPHTQITLKFFDVTISKQLPDGSTVPSKVENVKLDQLRFAITNFEEKSLEANLLNPLPAVPLPVVIDDTTGVSAWQTVSIITIDEEEEEERRRIREEQTRLRDCEQLAAPAKATVAVAAYDEETMYKGVFIGDEAGALANLQNENFAAAARLAKGADVSFRKKKRPPSVRGLGPAEKRIRGSAAEDSD